MTKKIINPWSWQDKYGFVQANEITGAQRMLFCAGQVSVDDDGNPLYPGDMEKQINQALDNLETVLRQAEVQLSDIVRLTYYTTDVSAFTGATQKLDERLKVAGCKPASTLLGVASLFHPDCVVEIEATAVV
ncbi:MAG: RidA family protein [Desulfobacteraceae bacterium]|nr:RidA family protein [Desulfobacteraceae bacterium]